MSNDILKSVSQGSDGAYDVENRRIKEISDELQRLCRLHEEKSRDGKGDGGRFEIEQGRRIGGLYDLFEYVVKNFT